MSTGKEVTPSGPGSGDTPIPPGVAKRPERGLRSEPEPEPERNQRRDSELERNAERSLGFRPAHEMLGSLPSGCPECGYPLQGLRSLHCPECGADVRAFVEVERPRAPSRRAIWFWRVVLGVSTPVGLGCLVVIVDPPRGCIVRSEEEGLLFAIISIALSVLAVARIWKSNRRALWRLAMVAFWLGSFAIIALGYNVQEKVVHRARVRAQLILLYNLMQSYRAAETAMPDRAYLIELHGPAAPGTNLIPYRVASRYVGYVFETAWSSYELRDMFEYEPQTLLDYARSTAKGPGWDQYGYGYYLSLDDRAWAATDPPAIVGFHNEPDDLDGRAILLYGDGSMKSVSSLKRFREQSTLQQLDRGLQPLPVPDPW